MKNTILHNTKLRLGALLTAALLALLCCVSVCAAEPKNIDMENSPYRILYISSYSYSWGTVPLQIEGIDRAFAGNEYVVNYEFMDTKNTTYTGVYNEFYQLLKFKMENRYPYDGVIVGDDAALNFAMHYRQELFRDIPITFLAVDNIASAQKAAETPRTTGIVERVDYAKNVEIAHKLLPHATKLFFVLDNRENGIGIAKQLEEQRAAFEGYQVEYLNASEYDHEELCQRLASFTEDDIVFFVSMGQQADGTVLTENERYQMMREYSNVPLFRVSPAGVGNGALGGYVVDFEQCGYMAGQMLIQMLESPQAPAPALVLNTPGEYYFDYTVMDHYNLRVARLPQQAVILNRPESFLKRNYNQIIIGLLVIALGALLLFFEGVHRAQIKLEAKNRELVIASNAKTDFLAHMSHDMRTPMNGILGITSLLQDRTDPAEIREDVKQIENSGHYLLSLINDTLDMSKIEAGKLELHPAPVNSEDLFQNVLATAHILAAQRGVTLKMELPPIAHGQWISVVTDASRIEQVFMNIISNAVKFTPPGGTVTIHMDSVSINEDSVTDRYIVSDTGIGMSEEFQKHLFEPFSQEGRANTDHESGTGLGLAIVKQIVDLMGGTLAIESTENVGTKVTVQITYPRYQGTLEVADAKTVDLSVLQGKRVLLCEDHPVNAQIALRLLAKQGLRADHAENGQLGLAMLQSNPPHTYDAVLMDVRMPVMDGISATKAIRALADRPDLQSIPIIAMTANAFDEDVRRCAEAGMDAHLAKPVEPAVMYDTIARQITKE